MKIGIQVRPWLLEGGTPWIALTEGAAAGYKSIEIGFQFISALGETASRELFDSTGVSLAALHTGFDWAGENPSELRERVGEVARLAKSLGGSYLLASTRPLGLDTPEAHTVASRVRVGLEAGAIAAADEGITLCVHNHAWEFARPGVFEELSGDLCLAVDLAHLSRSGIDVEEKLRTWGDRIRYLHLRDAYRGQWTGTLGEGELPLLHWIGLCSSSVEWAVVELEDDPTVPGLAATWPGSWTDRAAHSRIYLEKLLTT